MVAMTVGLSEYPASTRFSVTTGHAELRAYKDRIGVLLPECHESVEVNTSGELPGRWSWRDVPITDGLKSSAMVSSIVMTPPNEVFACIGIGLYRLHRKRGAWEPVDTSAAANSGATFGWLTGRDGESFTFQSEN